MKDEKVIVDDQVTTEVAPTAPPKMPLIITSFDLRFPVLEQKSLPCSIPLAPDDAQVVEKMKQELANLGEDAVGLAAVQIGIARTLFLMKRNDGSIIECVNPRIVSCSRELTRKAEGCLSLPKMMGFVSRPKTITLEYYDSLGGFHAEEFRGMEAKIVAHEMDHLAGRMINYHIQAQIDKSERLRDERLEARERDKQKRRRMAKIHKRMNRRK